MNALPKLAAKLVALSLPFPLAVMVAISAFSMGFFDSECGKISKGSGALPLLRAIKNSVVLLKDLALNLTGTAAGD